MVHPLVTQLRFARGEFVRGLEGVSAEDALRRIGPMNCLSWMLGHLAGQEQFLWVQAAQGTVVAPELRALVGTGQPASTPPWEDMWTTWRAVTAAADRYLDTITNGVLDSYLEWQGKPLRECIGTGLLRNTYHYWYHLGEAQALRQVLGHVDLPQYVGNMAEVKYA